MPAQIYKINSISDLLKSLDQVINLDETFWYRGHAKSDWRLLPSLARNPQNLEKESDLISRFKQNAALLLPNLPNSEWEWLCIMQHHGVPTRLLDWTESPLIGLYFAVDSCDENDGALWVLKPTSLNSESQIAPDYPKYIPSFEDDVLNSYTPSNMSSEKISRLKPIAVIGPRNTTRMQAQLGVFTVIHRDATPIEELSDGKHIVKLEIPHDRKEYIRRELSILGMGRFQLFPELQSLGDILKRI